MTFKKQLFLKSIFICCGILYLQSGYSQDVEPRRWSSIPLGINVVGAAYLYTNAQVNFDPVLELTDVSLEANTFAASYVRPFKLANKLARVDVVLPFSIDHWEGLLSGEAASTNRSGFMDPWLRLSVNLIGPPAGGPKELKEYYEENPVSTTFGVSLGVTLPFGQYFDEKLINVGNNRFVFRPQAGVVHRWGLWSYEVTGSLTIFTSNANFFNGNTLSQKPTIGLQSHLIRQFKNGMWASLSAAYNQGASSTINDVPKNDQRAYFFAGASLGYTFAGNQGIKIAYLRSRALRDVGSDFNSLALAWSMSFR
jgi:hypothetical protein